ncbi:TPA: ATP-binding protein [Klebsiella pneumoniae]|nr:ATP-binding protein [Klebsiella pneumoniae]
MMPRIVESNFYNVIKRKLHNNISLDQPVTILTGYNGCGKTTLLKCLHETITLYNNGNFPHARKGWGVEIKFDNNFKIKNYNMPPDLKRMELEDHNFFTEKVDINSSLSNGYNIILNRLNTLPEKSKKNKDNFKYAKEKTAIENNGLMQYPGKENLRNEVFSILLCDELFYFNGEESDNKTLKLEEMDIFSRNNNLSKTLYILLQEFAKKSILTDSDKKAKESINELKKLIIDAPEKLRLAITDKIKEIEENSSSKALDEFMETLNIFFSLTRRSVFIDEDGFISLNFDEQTIRWYDLSKGEKTLISLFLVTYLNRDKNVIFLFDEPDLSLHIKWQKILIENLAKMAPSSQFIISTHSPALIGNYEAQKIINISGMIRGQQ